LSGYSDAAFVVDLSSVPFDLRPSHKTKTLDNPFVFLNFVFVFPLNSVISKAIPGDPLGFRDDSRKDWFASGNKCRNFAATHRQTTLLRDLIQGLACTSEAADQFVSRVTCVTSPHNGHLMKYSVKLTTRSQRYKTCDPEWESARPDEVVINCVEVSVHVSRLVDCFLTRFQHSRAIIQSSCA